MALKYASMAQMSKADVTGLCKDARMTYPTTYTPTKFQMCLDLPTHIAVKMEEFEDVSVDIGSIGNSK